MITVEQPGPWAVCNSIPNQWGIINTVNGRRKVIGPISRPGQRKGRTNFFDRAVEEATKRNKESK